MVRGKKRSAAAILARWIDLDRELASRTMHKFSVFVIIFVLRCRRHSSLNREASGPVGRTDDAAGTARRRSQKSNKRRNSKATDLGVLADANSWWVSVI